MACLITLLKFNVKSKLIFFSFTYLASSLDFSLAHLPQNFILYNHFHKLCLSCLIPMTYPFWFCVTLIFSTNLESPHLLFNRPFFILVASKVFISFFFFFVFNLCTLKLSSKNILLPTPGS